MARIIVSRNDIYNIKDLIGIFGATRKEAFIEFLRLYFSCGEETAKNIFQSLVRKEVVCQSKNKYGYWRIVKSYPEKLVEYDNLDVFEAYVELYREYVKNINKPEDPEIKSERKIIQVGKMDFPYDFIFAVEGGDTYKVITFDDSGYQKLEFADRTKEKNREGTLVMIVVTSKSNPEPKSLRLSSDHRISLVRTAKKKVACIISETMEE